ncbi:hypothetical protein D3C84_681380 [compost metagenome]
MGKELMLQVVVQGIRSTTGRVVACPVAFLQQRYPHPGAPATTVPENSLGTFRGQGRLQVMQEFFDFILIERQCGRLGIVQLITQQEPWPIARRTSAPTEPPSDHRAAAGQQPVEQQVQFRVRHTAVVIDKQPGRCR